MIGLLVAAAQAKIIGRQRGRQRITGIGMRAQPYGEQHHTCQQHAGRGSDKNQLRP
jgi:hypothetical protein